MKKRGVIVLSLLLVLTLSINLIIADTSFPEDAYSCLKTKVNSGISSLTLEEKSFALMALAYDSSLQATLVTKINEEKDSD